MFDFIDGGITDFDDVEPISPPRRNGNTLSGYIMGTSSENSSIQNRSISDGFESFGLPDRVFDFNNSADFNASDDSDGWDSLEFLKLEGDVPLYDPFEYPYIGIEELLDEIIDISEIKGIREIIADDTELSPELKLDLLNKIDSKIKEK